MKLEAVERVLEDEGALRYETSDFKITEFLEPEAISNCDPKLQALYLDWYIEFQANENLNKGHKADHCNSVLNDFINFADSVSEGAAPFVK